MHHDNCMGDRTYYTHECARDWKRKQIANQIYELAREAGVLSAHDEAAFHSLYSAFVMDRSEEFVAVVKDFREKLQAESDAKQEAESQQSEGGVLLMEGIDEMPLSMRRQMVKRIQRSIDEEEHARASGGDAGCDDFFSKIENLDEMPDLPPITIDGNSLTIDGKPIGADTDPS